MLDSFNLTSFSVDFDADGFTRALCNDTKVIIPTGIEIKFMQGWIYIIAEFISSIKDIPVTIYSITDTYSVLDVKFKMETKRGELRMWRAATFLRSESISLCALCASDRKKHWKNNSTNKFCEECQQNAALINKTGTWLDKF